MYSDRNSLLDAPVLEVRLRKMFGLTQTPARCAAHPEQAKQYWAIMLYPGWMPTALVHYGRLPRNGILKAIADVLGVKTSGRTMLLLIKLQKQIMKMGSDNRSMIPVFVVDDAHLMEKESLMDICSLMCNPINETVATKLVLVGDKTLEKNCNCRP